VSFQRQQLKQQELPALNTLELANAGACLTAPTFRQLMHHSSPSYPTALTFPAPTPPSTPYMCMHATLVKQMRLSTT
jgi:hypothetical protein